GVVSRRPRRPENPEAPTRTRGQEQKVYSASAISFKQGNNQASECANPTERWDRARESTGRSVGIEGGHRRPGAEVPGNSGQRPEVATRDIEGGSGVRGGRTHDAAPLSFFGKRGPEAAVAR